MLNALSLQIYSRPLKSEHLSLSSEVTYDSIALAICSVLNINIEDLVGNRSCQKPEFVYPRYLYFYICDKLQYKIYGYRTYKCAAYFGKHHSSVNTGKNKIQDYIWAEDITKKYKVKYDVELVMIKIQRAA